MMGEMPPPGRGSQDELGEPFEPDGVEFCSDAACQGCSRLSVTPSLSELFERWASVGKLTARGSHVLCRMGAESAADIRCLAIDGEEATASGFLSEWIAASTTSRAADLEKARDLQLSSSLCAGPAGVACEQSSIQPATCQGQAPQVRHPHSRARRRQTEQGNSWIC